MSKNKKCIIISGLILLVSAAAAFGQTNRTYVAESGSDLNLCSRTAPCKTIGRALSVVNTGGEVVIAENGEYKPFTVNKTVIISAAPGVDAIIRTSGAHAALISGALAYDSVTFRNLTFKGFGPDIPSKGIINQSAGTVFIDNCVLYGFTSAIYWSGIGGKLFIHETSVRNSVNGIEVSGIDTPSPTEFVQANVDNCRLENNTTGIYIASNVEATIRNSLIAGNTSYGIHLYSNITNRVAQAMIENCLLNTNGVGLYAASPFTGPSGTSIAVLSRSTINNSLQYGAGSSYGNSVYSTQNNTFFGNGFDVSGTLKPLTLK